MRIHRKIEESRKSPRGKVKLLKMKTTTPDTIKANDEALSVKNFASWSGQQPLARRSDRRERPAGPTQHGAGIRGTAKFSEMLR